MPPLGTFGNQPHATRQSFGVFGAAGANATHYDGATQYSERAGGLVGIADSKQVVASMWFNTVNDAPSSLYSMLYIEYLNGDMEIDYFTGLGVGGANGLKILASDGRVDAIFDTAPDFAALGVVKKNEWNHLICSFDVSIPVGKIYLNDADVTPALVMNNRAIPFTAGTPANKIAGLSTVFGATSGFQGCISEAFFNTSYLDLTVTANRRKFITAGGRPVNPGANTNALGFPPLFYCPDGKAINLGTGGDLTPFNAPTVCGTGP